MIFLDTSVLIAGTQLSHPHNPPSHRLLASLTAQQVSIAAHTLAEVYAGLTSIPPRNPPAIALQAIETYLQGMQPVTLSAQEYLDTIRKAATNGHTGGAIYDALLLACARKINAERIYTWNLKHFRALAPDLATRIQTP
jgi:predicted nucleic acid-binding protein